MEKPQLIEDIDIVSQYGTKVHLQCADNDANIYYTLDGSIPTRPYKDVLVNNDFDFFFND